MRYRQLLLGFVIFVLGLPAFAGEAPKVKKTVSCSRECHARTVYPMPTTYQHEPFLIRYIGEIGAQIGEPVSMIFSAPSIIITAPASYVIYGEFKTGVKFPIQLGKRIGNYVGYHAAPLGLYIPKLLLYNMPKKLLGIGKK